MKRFMCLFSLLAFAGAASAATALQTGQNVQVTATGQDASGNAATLTNIACDIDNHVIAYCATNGSSPVWVVSRGPVGNFRLTVTGTNSAGATITNTSDFTVTPGAASVIVLTVGAPAGWSLLVPSMPAGW